MMKQITATYWCNTISSIAASWHNKTSHGAFCAKFVHSKYTVAKHPLFSKNHRPANPLAEKGIRKPFM
jgi:hypothetical protein